MTFVKLKSRVGSHHIRRRVMKPSGEYVVESYSWSFDNNFICELPKDYWEQLEHEFIDRQANLRYREVFTPL